LQSAQGQIQGGATIRLEDPSQDALIAGQNGQLTYAGNGAQFEQVMLHEIGHALGLADDSDPHSIMYYAMTPQNRTLDSTDRAGIEQLYGAPSPRHPRTADR
jgi:hypothetical protein